ncbi:MAG: tetratricopeptide repeat protein [Candidatus Riflebacteria bacterium]|nr:tetratricopeptide repeat protein [Candidatus Riflebacteria bacterium]
MKRILTITLTALMLTSILLAQAVSFNPDAAALYQNAMNLLRLRRLSAADQQFRELIEKFPEDIHVMLARRQLASILRDTRQYDEAIDVLKEIIRSDKSPDNVRYAQQEILDILHETQRFKQGVELIEEWRRDAPQDIFLSRQLARFYLQSGRKDEAWLLLESIMEQSQSAPEAFKDLLELALRSGDIEKLMQVIESRRARWRSTVYADYMSDCYLALGRKDKAVEVLNQIDEVKEHPVLLRKLADLQISLGNYAEAQDSLTLLLKIMPDDWNTLRRLGHCLFMQNKKDEALQTWRSPLKFPFMQRLEFYQDYTTVLIEHQLYEEALKAFDEARKILQQPTMFAEEYASVLDALGRSEEALEEYLKVLGEGFYRQEVFEKLYSAAEKGFDLEAGLQRMRQQSSYNLAILQALLELYFRRASMKDIEEVREIVRGSAGNLDAVFYERLNQEALLLPEEFHFVITRLVMQSRSDSGLALRLAMLLLEMGPNDHAWRKDAYNAAKEVAESRSVADANLKSLLLIKLAEYALYEFNDVGAAHGFLDAILQTDLMRAVPDLAVHAAIIKARIMTFEENYNAALELLKQNEEIVKRANQDLFSGDPISESDFQAMIHLERARLHAHKGDYQNALQELKVIIDAYSESEWVNDALEMANFITRRSTGDFTLLKTVLKAERLAMTGKRQTARDELKALITANATASALIDEIRAELLQLQEYDSDPTALIAEIDKFAQEKPDYYKTADLWELKWHLMKRKSASQAEIREHLQTFIDNFPSDLRSGRFKKILVHKAEQENNR